MHGVVRFTTDLDLIVDLTTENPKAFITVMEDLKFKPRLPVELQELLDADKRSIWINEKNMIVFTIYNPQYEIEEIDLFIKEIIPFEEIAKELLWLKVKDFNIPVVSRKYLKEAQRAFSKSTGYCRY